MLTCLRDRSQLRWLCAYGARLSSASARKETRTKEQREKQMHQFFLSGVRFLKEDPEKLTNNLKNRGVSLDVDSMVGKMIQVLLAVLPCSF